MTTGSPATISLQGQGPSPERKYYTAKDINATAGSRNAVSTALHKGAVLILDAYGHDLGKGADVAQPQTAHLDNPPFVLLQVPSDPDAAGVVTVAPWQLGKVVQVRVDGGSVNIAFGDPLVMQNGSFDLVKGVAPLTGDQQGWFMALEAATANNTLIAALCVLPSGEAVTTALSALTENTGAIGGTNDGDLPALVNPAGDSGASVIAGIRENSTKINAIIAALKTANIAT